MNIEYENIYKTAREAIGISQEEAAYRLEVSCRTVSNCETFTSVPKEELVLKMIEVYEAPWLAYMYFKRSTLLGRKYLPEIDLTDLARSVLKFQKELGDIRKVTPDLIDVACDGVIELHEEDKWNKVQKEIIDFIGAGVAVLYAAK